MGVETVTIAANIIAVAAANGFSAIARDDGAAALIFIPTRTPILYADGSVADYDDGFDAVEVSSVSEARAALGY